MRTVRLGPERFVVIPELLIQTTELDLWEFHAPYRGYEIEVLVGGNDKIADSVRLALAEKVVAQLDAFVPVAVDYLKCFIHEQVFERPGEWGLEGLEFGRRGSEPFQSFELSLRHEGDRYGLWNVAFREGSEAEFHPYRFSRTQV